MREHVLLDASHIGKDRIVMDPDPQVQQHPVILLVEDNPDHAELVRRNLEALGVENPVTHLLDGEAAIRYLTRQNSYADPASNPLPCLVLLDLRLPKVDGLEVLKLIKSTQQLQHLSVVVLTTSEAKSDIESANSLGADGYLVKPLELSQFKELVEKFMPVSVCPSHLGKPTETENETEEG